MTETSQNGWPVDGYYGNRQVPGPWSSRNINVRKDDAGDILLYISSRFDVLVQDIDAGIFDDWGQAYRPIRGQSSGLSNHASGTAIDLNATQHPLGRKGTFSAAAIAGIHKVLAEVDGLVRWGGDYSGRVDEMHFEINVRPGDPRLAVVAARCRTAFAIWEGQPVPSVPVAPAPTPGPVVSAGVPAPPFPLPAGYYFGPLNGPRQSISCQAPNGSDARYRPSLKAWQQRMIDRGWGACFGRYGADGMFGKDMASSEAANAARQFQAEKGLAVDGLVGPATWRAAWEAPITR